MPCKAAAVGKAEETGRGQGDRGPSVWPNQGIK